MLRHKYAWTVLYTLCITFFTLYVMLDTFVLSRAIEVEHTDGTAVTSSLWEGDAETTAESIPEETTAILTPIITENSYQDNDIRITIEKMRYCDTNVYVADVEISSMEYFRSAFAKQQYGRNITARTSETALANDAIFAVNGDYYGARAAGYVIRNGYIYRESISDREALVVYADGSMDYMRESSVSAQALLEDDALHVFSFGPGLVRDGEICIDPQYEKGNASTKNPRTAVGMISPLHYVFIVTDGRNGDSRGLTVRELAALMVELEVQCAYNLDGGGSSTMYFNGELVNGPSENGRRISERSVSDIVYIGK